MAGRFLICGFGVYLWIPTRLLKCATVFQYWSLFTILGVEMPKMMVPLRAPSSRKPVLAIA
jgi:hypothetical protein